MKKNIYIIALLVSVIFMLLSIQTAYAGEYLGEWHVTRYYTPEPGQGGYANGWRNPGDKCTGHWTDIKRMYWNGYRNNGRGDYSADKCINTGGSSKYHTKNGFDLRGMDTTTIAACPPKYLPRTLHLSYIGYVYCADVGGSIKGKLIDIFAGIGQQGFNNMAVIPGGSKTTHLLTE